MSHKKFNASLVTGTFTGVAPAGVLAGPTVHIGGDKQKVKYLSARVNVDAETNTITLAGKWQGSNDNSTYYDIAYAPNNAAVTVLATGTGGADAAVEKVLPAPDSVYGFRYARLAFIVGVVTGTDNDTYSLGYNYVQLGPRDGI